MSDCGGHDFCKRDELEAKATRWFGRACEMERERDAARAELEDEKLAWEQQRAAYVEMRAERDDAKHGRDLARLDTENEQRLIATAWAEADRLAAALRNATDSLWTMVEQTKREGYLALSDRLYLLASDLGAASER